MTNDELDERRALGEVHRRDRDRQDEKACEVTVTLQPAPVDKLCGLTSIIEGNGGEVSQVMVYEIRMWLLAVAKGTMMIEAHEGARRYMSGGREL